jgi:archaellum component FlaC
MTTDERFDRIDARMDRLEASLGEIKESVKQILDSNAQLTASVSQLTESVNQLTKYVLDFRQETAQHFEVIDNRLDVLTATVANIEARSPTLIKGVLDFGKLATQITNDQFKSRHATSELGSPHGSPRREGFQAHQSGGVRNLKARSGV